MLVKCEDLEDLKDNNQVNYCQFYTSIYGNLDRIFLNEGQTFSQYILKGQKYQYYTNFSKEQNVKEIHLELLNINGEIDLVLNDDANNCINYNKYILSNQIFYRIYLNNNKYLKRLTANIYAKINSYYVIEYKLIRASDD